jgi:hypothetical protein
MTLRELIQAAAGHSVPLAAALLALPVLAWLAGVVHGKGRGNQTPWQYFYCALVYLACLPGTFAAVLTAYALFFRNENLLDVNLFLYVLPILSMVVTLILIRKNVDFDDVPGFDRLSGLMVLMACSFGLALAIHKTRIFVGFFGSMKSLFALAAATFALLKWGAYMLLRRKDEPSKERPTFPAPR